MVPFKLSHEENLALKRAHTQACVLGVFGQFLDQFKKNHEEPLRVYWLMFFFFSLPRVIQVVIKKLVRLSGNERMAMVMDWVHEYTRDEIDEALRGKEKIDREINHRW